MAKLVKKVESGTSGAVESVWASKPVTDTSRGSLRSAMLYASGGGLLPSGGMTPPCRWVLPSPLGGWGWHPA